MPESPPATPPDSEPAPRGAAGSTEWWQQPRRHPWWTALAVVVLGLIVLVALWDWNWFKAPVERQVENRTGREFRIKGDLDVDLGWTPTIRANDVHFANAKWARNPEMASAEQLELSIDVLRLLRGKVRIPHLRLAQPHVSLEANPEGGGNWQLRNSGGGDSNLEFRRVWISRGELVFLDEADKTDIKVGVTSAAAKEAGNAPPIQVKGGGQWRGNEFTVEGTAESPVELRDVDSPYQIDARAQAGATKAHARGTLLDPLRMRDFDLQLNLSGKNLDDLYPLIGVALPPTPPYTLEGRLTRDINGSSTTWHYDKFSGTVGDSDLAGSAAFTTGGDRPLLKADLHSKRLDFDDLAGLVGGAPQTGPGETSNPELTAKAAEMKARQRVLPDTPYRLEKMRAMDADVSLKADRINAPSLPLDNMNTRLSLNAGLLVLDPLDFGVAGGKIQSTVRMDARESDIRTHAKVQVRGLDLSRMLPKVESLQNAIGKISGHVDLTGHGNSIAAMLGSSDGQVEIGMGSGKISNMLMEMAGIDIAEIIKFKLTGDRLIPIRCAFGEFKVADGTMTAGAFAFDTTDTMLLGEGTIDLKNEQLDLIIRPRPKDRSILAFRAPLLVDGSFKHPGIRPDLKRVGLRGAIALALGSIAPPAALLATLELGPGEDAGCGGQYAK
ncbi:AsmA family protein [Novilysobacter avium]|uniref:AsmA family protein n=1 Tax=Novilysobacter avium TaxID=2781023 RepID=A0A7S6ULW6_9GAMM|nr:AsmA family protein [Lysobacter avium]QOW22687.1 AsmA family protein [Lysobacter avium]